MMNSKTKTRETQTYSDRLTMAAERAYKRAKRRIHQYENLSILAYAERKVAHKLVYEATRLHLTLRTTAAQRARFERMFDR